MVKLYHRIILKPYNLLHSVRLHDTQESQIIGLARLWLDY